MAASQSSSPRKAAVRAQQDPDAELAGVLRLHAIYNRLIAKVSFAELAAEILDAAIDLSEADFGTFQILDGEVLRIVAQRGFGPDFLEFFQTVRHDTAAVCGRALALRGRVVVEDVASEPFFQGTPSREVLLKAGVRAVQTTPMFGRSGELYGMIATHFRRVHKPTERHLRYLDLLASQATSFIDRLRLDEFARETEKLKAIALMANSVAHEINNPLQALTNIITLLEADTTAENRPNLISMARDQLANISQSIQKLPR